jgi:hypothetical protein
MSNEFTFEVEFEVPDEVGEDNVLLVLREFFGDLVETHRFIDAKVNTEETERDTFDLNEDERQRLLDMLSSVTKDDVQTATEILDELESDE